MKTKAPKTHIRVDPEVHAAFSEFTQKTGRKIGASASIALMQWIQKEKANQA